MTTVAYKIVLDEDFLGPFRKLPRDVKEQLYERLPTLEAEPGPYVRLIQDRVAVRVRKDDDYDWLLVCRPEPEIGVLLILSCLLETNETRRQMLTNMSREEAIAIVQAGIGKRPDLPSGDDYVDSIRWIWKGFAPDGRSDS